MDADKQTLIPLPSRRRATTRLLIASMAFAVVVVAARTLISLAEAEVSSELGDGDEL